MPAFAMTAHAAQGQTFSRGAIVDPKIGGSASTMSSYVALTQVERREDLLIDRPFPKELFDKGQKPGLELLLQVWRGDKIDRKAIELEHMPSKWWPNCETMKYKHDYPTYEWNKKREKRQVLPMLNKTQGGRIAISVQRVYAMASN